MLAISRLALAGRATCSQASKSQAQSGHKEMRDETSTVGNQFD